jgi:Fe-S-cluster-containing hydrogenase component 2
VNAIAMEEGTGAKVVIEPLCLGCHLCTIACPYGTVFTLPQSDLASKCNLCGGHPACVTSCPTDAIRFQESDAIGEWFGPWSEQVNTNYIQATSN